MMNTTVVNDGDGLGTAVTDMMTAVITVIIHDIPGKVELDTHCALDTLYMCPPPFPALVATLSTEAALFNKALKSLLLLPSMYLLLPFTKDYLSNVNPISWQIE